MSCFCLNHKNLIISFHNKIRLVSPYSSWTIINIKLLSGWSHPFIYNSVLFQNNYKFTFCITIEFI